jgi:orotate phosphoribosyltransferase-like protein
MARVLELKNQGLSATRIAKGIGVGQNTILRHAAQAGIRFTNSYVKIDFQRARELSEQGVTVSKIAKILGVSRDRLYIRMRIAGIPVNLSKATITARARGSRLGRKLKYSVDMSEVNRLRSEGLTLKQIGEQLRVPRDTVKQKILKARMEGFPVIERYVEKHPTMEEYRRIARHLNILRDLVIFETASLGEVLYKREYLKAMVRATDWIDKVRSRLEDKMLHDHFTKKDFPHNVPNEWTHIFYPGEKFESLARRIFEMMDEHQVEKGAKPNVNEIETRTSQDSIQPK